MAIEMPEPDVAPSAWLCRCEEVSADQVRAAIAAGAGTLNDVKRRTRAGMGFCQGTYCQVALAALLATEAGCSLDQVPPVTARPPVRPISLDRLAELGEGDS
ncbi:MAG: (2Fe-2S)-binding protein [Chloroflexota bacterium]|nr:(2Fe-2S)-binding protein [Chloroflexota bacterium]